MSEEDLGQRRDERKDVRWQAKIIHNEVEYESLIGNVSLAGLLTNTDAPLNQNDEIVLVIPNVGEFAGIVMWSDKPFFGLALMVGPELDLKRFTVGSGEDVSQRPTLGDGDDWI